jgi:hypothetical protein
LRAARTWRGFPHFLDIGAIEVKNHPDMSVRNLTRRTLCCLVFLAVVCEGLVGALPHIHEVVVTTNPECENPVCPDPSRAHVDVVGDDHADHACLACSVRVGPALAASPSISHGAEAACQAGDADVWAATDLPRRWSLPHRGPPVVA